MFLGPEKENLPGIEPLSEEELLGTIEAKGKDLAQKSHENRNFERVSTCHYTLPSLEYVGIKHSYDPEHPQFETLRQSIFRFVSSKSAPVLLVEGSIPEVVGDEVAAIASGGERGFAAFLAGKAGILVESLEPSRIDEAQFLQQFFSQDQIEYYYFLRASRDYFRKGGGKDKGVSFEGYAEGILEAHKRQLGDSEAWKEFDFSIEHIKAIHSKMFDSDFATFVELRADTNVDPRGNDSPINEVSARCDQFRDLHHIKKIREHLAAGRQVMVVNGEEHAVVQKPALEKLLGTDAVVVAPESWRVLDKESIVKTFENLSGNKLSSEAADDPELLVAQMWEALKPRLDEYIERFAIPVTQDEGEANEQFLLRVLQCMRGINQGLQEKRDWSECPEIALGIGEGAFNCVFGSQVVARVCERNGIPVEAGLLVGHLVAVAEVSPGRKLFLDASNSEIAELTEIGGRTCLVGGTLHGRKMLAYTRLQNLPIQYSAAVTINNTRSLIRTAQEGDGFAQRVVQALQPNTYTPYETAKCVLMPQYIKDFDLPEWLEERKTVQQRRSFMQSNLVEMVYM